MRGEGVWGELMAQSTTVHERSRFSLTMPRVNSLLVQNSGMQSVLGSENGQQCRGVLPGLTAHWK